MELGRNIRVTFFFTLCLTWHIMTKYGTLENVAKLVPSEMNSSCVNDTSCLNPLESHENASESCVDLDWFWETGRGLGWNNPSSERISTFDFFYGTNALTCGLLLVFIIR